MIIENIMIVRIMGGSDWDGVESGWAGLVGRDGCCGGWATRVRRTACVSACVATSPRATHPREAMTDQQTYGQTDRPTDRSTFYGIQPASQRTQEQNVPCGPAPKPIIATKGP